MSVLDAELELDEEELDEELEEDEELELFDEDVDDDAEEALLRELEAEARALD